MCFPFMKNMLAVLSVLLILGASVRAADPDVTAPPAMSHDVRAKKERTVVMVGLVDSKAEARKLTDAQLNDLYRQALPLLPKGQ